MSLAESSARWLAEQNPKSLCITYEILSRREKFAAVRESERMHESGVIYGLTLALSHVQGDRPGDISSTGAEGFISNVESAGQYIAEAKTDGN